MVWPTLGSRTAKEQNRNRPWACFLNGPNAAVSTAPISSSAFVTTRLIVIDGLFIAQNQLGMFGRFNSMQACDRQTDGQTDTWLILRSFMLVKMTRIMQRSLLEKLRTLYRPIAFRQ